MSNKRGFTTLMLLGFLGVSLLLMVILGVFVLFAGEMDAGFQALNGTTLGNQNWGDAYAQNLQPAMTTLQTTVPRNISLGILIGMIIMMTMAGFVFQNKSTGWILADFVIIILSVAGAVMVSESFTTFINIDPTLLSIFSNELGAASRFILNLPVIVPIVGVLIMIATYALSKRRDPLDRAQGGIGL